MKKYLLIAGSNLKKKKGDVFTQFLLIVLATVMMYNGISVLLNIGTVLDNVKKETNGADVLHVSAYPDSEAVEEKIRSYEATDYYEVVESQYYPVAKYYKEGAVEEEIPIYAEVYEPEARISMIHVVDQAEEFRENSLILPYYTKVVLGYETGDTIFIEIGEVLYEFELYGFLEDVIFATPSNMSVYRIAVSQKRFEEISQDQNGAADTTSYRIMLKDGYGSKNAEGEIASILTAIAPDYDLGLISNYETMKMGDSLTASIVMAIVVIFSLLILVVVLVIIRFSIRNSIERNMTNIGIMEAAGFTSGQMIAASVMESVIICATAMFVGMFCAGFVAGVFGSLIASTIGVRWNVSFDIICALITCATVFLLVIIATFLAVRKIRKITILDELRGGITNHNFRKNYFSLEKTHMPLNLALGMKGIFHKKKQNVGVMMIAAVMAFACCLSFFLYVNFVPKIDSIILLSGIENATATLTLHGDEDYEEVKKNIENLAQVEAVNGFHYAVVDISSKDKEVHVDVECIEDTDEIRTNTISKGRMPKYENEIVLSRPIAMDLDVKIGDVVLVESMNHTKEYVVCGISQHIERLGRKAVLTLEGMGALSGSFMPSQLYIYSAKDYSFADIESAMKELYPEYELGDMISAVESACQSISNAMFFVCAIFVTCTILITVLIIFLLVRMKLTRERVMLGVDKALGFTTGQLIKRMIMNFLPVVGIGSVFGAVASFFLLEPLVALCFTFCGIKTCTLEENPVFILLGIILLVSVTVVTTMVSSIKIRNIEPSKMIKE